MDWPPNVWMDRVAVVVYLGVILAFTFRGWHLEKVRRQERWIRYQLLEELARFGVKANVSLDAPFPDTVKFTYDAGALEKSAANWVVEAIRLQVELEAQGYTDPELEALEGLEASVGLLLAQVREDEANMRVRGILPPHPTLEEDEQQRKAD